MPERDLPAHFLVRRVSTRGGRKAMSDVIQWQAKIGLWRMVTQLGAHFVSQGSFGLVFGSKLQPL